MVVGDVTGNPSLNDLKKEFKPAQRHEDYRSKIFCLKVNF